MAVEIPQLARTAIDLAHRNLIHTYLTSGEAKRDREIAHERALRIMEVAQKYPIVMGLMNKMFTYNDPILKTSFAGLTTPNPLGVAAGFDKDARVYRFFGDAQGFGSVTDGSIARIDYGGNQRPRVYDLPHSRALDNRMGFPGQGSKKAAERFSNDKKPRNFLLIVNFAASKPSFERGTQIEDYRDVARDLVDFGDEGEMNVSSPNTPGVRGLQEPDVFSDLADAVFPVYIEYGKPVRPKFSPDLEDDKLYKNVRTTIDKKGSGITLTNTSTDPEIKALLSPLDIHREEPGGTSGAPITQKALEMSHRLYEYIGEEIPIHRVGGIMNVRDGWDALTYGGATTVDVFTSMVRKETSTPNFSYYFLRDLAKAMRANGMTGMKDFKELRGKKVPFPKI